MTTIKRRAHLAAFQIHEEIGMSQWSVERVAEIIAEKISEQKAFYDEELDSILDWIDRTSIIFEDMPGAYVNAYELKDLLLKVKSESEKINIFANAVRGDKFRTRNGELAIYLGSTDDRTSYLIYEDNQIRTVFNDTGCYNNLACFTNPEDYLLSIDIMSRWDDR